MDGAGADPANPADQPPVTVNNSFQLANCQNLAVQTDLQGLDFGQDLATNGASLALKLTYPKAPQGTQANIEGQGRSPQAAPVASIDPAEGVPGRRHSTRIPPTARRLPWSDAARRSHRSCPCR